MRRETAGDVRLPAPSCRPPAGGSPGDNRVAGPGPGAVINDRWPA
jgi:hypothetical protein